MGTWHLFLAANSLLVAKTNFLVTPLGYWKNKKIDAEKTKEVNNASDDSYHVTEEITKKWSHLLRSVNFRKQTAHITDYENKFDSNLDQWIDKLVQEHYEIDQMCNFNDDIDTKLKLRKCINTHWSSLSPDSKADISTLC